ncbi:cyclic GMP-AMP synthase-like receptor [Battus philenor]|uniref:cyclic GMP-AMP synthase-like receptor n=1 Tax=Battus philenor TaxID=42288 RepID=UPI0035CEE1B3
MAGKKKNLDVYLMHVYNQFIAIKENDFRRSQEVFKSVFEQVKVKIGEQCNFFNKYARQVMYGGSVYDGTKVSQMDEFDMDIVINLPINYDNAESGIIMEYDSPGFVKMKICSAFDNLDKQKEWETCHKVTRDWRDDKKYFLQSKFRHWLHSNIQKALNEMGGKVTVNGDTFIMKYKESGPAYTLQLRNMSGEDHFQLDVDLVPVIRFMLPRWPQGYRTVNDTKAKEWLVVPKPKKELKDETIKSRCWRLSFQEFEREMLKECMHLKVVIRLIKKLKNSLKMKAIASYYIKTLFLWKVEKNKLANIKNKEYWRNNVSELLRIMLQEFHDAIKEKNIPYFWNKKNNLIENLNPTHQKEYLLKLKDVLIGLNENDVEKTIFAFLTPEEMEQFKSSMFYKEHLNQSCSVIASPKTVNVSTTSSSIQESLVTPQVYQAEVQTMLKMIMEKLDMLTQKVMDQEDRLRRLEMNLKLSESKSE